MKTLFLFFKKTRFLSHVFIFVKATICLLIFFQTLQAQYRFESWTTDNGLPQNGVRGIAQTPDGYLWFTTFDGLVRYDGAKFTVFDKNNTKGISSNRFALLYVEKDGTLFAGTEEGGLTVYRDGHFKSYTTADGLPTNLITGFELNIRGEFYITTEKGNFYFRNGKIIPVPDADIPFKQHSYFSPSGTIWTYDESGVKQISPDKHETFYPIKTEFYNNYFSGMRMFEDGEGNLWFGDLTGVYCLKNGAIRKFTTADGVPLRTCLRPYLQDTDGSVWFASGMHWIEGAGLVRYKDGKFTAWDKRVGLSSNFIANLFKDSEGAIWVTTDKGLNRLQKQFVSPLSIADGLPYAEVYPLLQTKNGDIYVGTTQGLIHYRAGKFNEVPIRAINGSKISVTALYEDIKGRLWIGAVGDLHRLENGKLMDIPELYRITVWAIQNDREGNIWVASSNGLFVFRNDKLVAKYTTANGLPSDDIKIIHEDRNGALWIGTYGGIAVLSEGVREWGSKGETESRGVGEKGSKGEGKKGIEGEKRNLNNNGSVSPTPPLPYSPTSSALHSPTVFTVANGLASDRVRTIYEDNEGAFWIGTYDGGLSRFKDGKFFNFTIENGLFNNGVFQILEDDKNNFWISCNKGIYRVNRRELEDFAAGRIQKINSIAYGKQDGMLNTECNGGRQPAGIKTADGKFWFPTQEGVVVINPYDVSYNPKPPPVQIEKVLIERHETDFQNGITLRANNDNLEIRYTGISFIKPEQIKFRYRIEGLSENWTDVQTIREVYFPSLPAGEYTFHIVAANSDGVWNEEGARLKILVRAPFWKKTWFIVLCSLAIIAVAFTVFRLRVKELKRRQLVQQEFSRRLLESQELERKRIASEMHDSLGQYLLAIKNWALFGLNSITTENPAREHLNEISDTSSLALEGVREIAHNLRPYQLERLGLTNTLEYMMKNIGSASAIHFVNKIENIDDALSKESQIIFYRIAQECVNNIIKHSKAENAWLTVRQNGNGVELICQDDGKGFDFETAKNSSKSGLGLNGIEERVRMLDGEYMIDSEAGKGTTVSVKIRKSQ